MNKDIAIQVGTFKKTVSLWRRRFAEKRLPGIERDAPRPGRTPSIPTTTVERILHLTTLEKPTAALTEKRTRPKIPYMGIPSLGPKPH